MLVMVMIVIMTTITAAANDDDDDDDQGKKQTNISIGIKTTVIQWKMSVNTLVCTKHSYPDQ